MNIDFKELFGRISSNCNKFADEHVGALLQSKTSGSEPDSEPSAPDLKDIREHALESIKVNVQSGSCSVFCLINHPLDKESVTKINELSNHDLYQSFQESQELWKLLLRKSVECLRYYDTREPFLKISGKIPVAYGREELYEYFKSFIDFESLLYGSSPYYRDHVIHTLHVWKLGVEELLSNDALLEGLKADLMHDIKSYAELKTTSLEIISMWTLAALCHDLGYPLEKARQIIDKTQLILNHFVENAQIPFSVNFTGIQNEINSLIVKIMSSKLKPTPASSKLMPTAASQGAEEGSPSGKTCSAGQASAASAKPVSNAFLMSIQPKYFMKFAASLERYDHGIISSLILYKLLMYFKESEFAMNENYELDAEGARQFYIRREILRAISSHTCADIYHMTPLSLSFLLHVCDDMHGWDRKSFQDMYAPDDGGAGTTSVFVAYTDAQVNIEDVIEYTSFGEAEALSFLNNLCRLMKDLQKRYRDGPDTDKRKFSFKRTFKIREKPNGQAAPDGMAAELVIPNAEAARINYKIASFFKDKKSIISSMADNLSKKMPFEIRHMEWPDQ